MKLPARLAVLASRRWLLWGALLLLVVALLVVLVFLAAEYEEGRDQSALETDAAATASDIRAGLLRNVQTLQSLHSVAPTAASWEAPAAELLAISRELVRLEWRDNQLNLLASRDSPYQAGLFDLLPRQDALPDLRLACENARRLSGHAFSPSYFWPLPGGQGLELVEMCLPVVRAGKPQGYLVATYSLHGILSELTNRDLLRGRGLAFHGVIAARTEAEAHARHLARHPGDRNLFLPAPPQADGEAETA